jgi:hypothetical protein
MRRRKWEMEWVVDFGVVGQIADAGGVDKYL